MKRITTPYHYPMPNSDEEITELLGCTYFAKFELSMEYWQLAHDPVRQVWQFFISPNGVRTPTRLLRERTAAVAHLQSALPSAKLQKLHPTLIRRFDDILLYDKTDDAVLDDGIMVQKFCAHSVLHLSSARCMHSVKDICCCVLLLFAGECFL